MLSFLTIALLVYGSMHLYALRKVWTAFDLSLGSGLALALTGLVLTGSPLLVWLLERHGTPQAAALTGWLSYVWMGFLFLFLCLGLLLDLGRALARRLNRDWPLSKRAALQTVSLLALAMLGYGFVEARQLRVVEVRVTTPKLAAGQVTIAQISDLHLGLMMGGEFLDRVMAKLREVKPDMLVATGDIVDGHGDDLDALARRFHAYTPPLGAYAVIGNHERHAGLDTSLRFLRDAGFAVLRSQSARVGGIVLLGLDDTLGAPSQAGAGSLSSAEATLANASDFVVLLKHQPVVDPTPRFDLQLSGHTHGGQIFPFGGLTWLRYRINDGLTELADGRSLYVNRGAGTWGPPIRLFSAPEITLISIRSSHTSR
jgi:predicted MPP superfamily phosphohydrolase